jgi:transcriptional regulator with XRE-family HTH domain
MPRSKKYRYDWKACGHRMRVTRIALGLSEKEAAEAWCVTLPTYRRYEAGALQRSVGGCLNFAEKFDVSIDWLMAGDPDQLDLHLTKNTTGNVALLPMVTAKRRHFKAHIWPETLARMRAVAEEKERRARGFGKVMKFHLRPH